MGQAANVIMGLSVKAMIFHQGKLLLLQKTMLKDCSTGNFPAVVCSLQKTSLQAFRGK